MTPELHDRVMNRANRLWHEQGQPNGSYRQFWDIARREVLAEAASDPGTHDALSWWAPARPRPRQQPSALQRLKAITTHNLRRVMNRA